MPEQVQTLTEVGAHAAVLPGHRVPAQAVGGAKGFLTVAQIAAYMLATLAFDPAGSAAAAQSAAIASAAASLSAHASALDPHPGYLTTAEGAAAFDPLGAASTVQGLAAAALAAHVAAVDPHPGYLTPAEGAAAYDALGAAASAQAASQPLAANLTSWAALAPAAKQDASANLSAWSALATSAKQDQSANLDAWSAIATATKQAAHANLTTIAGLASITPLTRLAASGETVTTSSPLLDLAQTWNAGGVTFTGLKFNVTDTASAAASLLLDLQVGGTTKFNVNKTGVLSVNGGTLTYSATSGPGAQPGVSVSSASAGYAYSLAYGFSDTNRYSGMGNVQAGGQGLYIASTGALMWSSSVVGSGTIDTFLYRDAANILAQRNSTNAQAFRLYNTYTDASNYERLNVAWGSNIIDIAAAALGTGSQRQLRVDGSQFHVRTGGTTRWYWDGSGHFLAATDNTYDIGASGATRPRNVYVANSIVNDGQYSAGPAGSYIFVGRGRIYSPADGVLQLTNAAANDFTRLNFGGSTSSFPALKRSGTQLQVRLADDSNNGSLYAGYLEANSYISTCLGIMPAGGTAGAGYKMSSTANFGIFFGSGAPTLAAAKGSLYLRSDGSGVNNRMYVNTDGSTAWAAVETVS